MRIRYFFVCLLSVVFATNVHAQQKPLSADDILNDAMMQAAKENKNVFIIFHASWCGWCRKMDSSMNDASVKKFFDDNYVIRHLVVYESKDKKNLENPGAMDLLVKYHSADLGLPSWLVFDAKGKLLADSQLRPAGTALETTGENVGCPAKKNEVEYFIKVLQQTSSLKPVELSLIEKRFRMNE
jgi:thioredoxin-related protein